MCLHLSLLISKVGIIIPPSIFLWEFSRMRWEGLFCRLQSCAVHCVFYRPHRATPLRGVRPGSAPWMQLNSSERPKADLPASKPARLQEREFPPLGSSSFVAFSSWSLLGRQQGVEEEQKLCRRGCDFRTCLHGASWQPGPLGSLLQAPVVLPMMHLGRV